MNHRDTEAQRGSLNNQEATGIHLRRAETSFSAPCLGVSVVHPEADEEQRKRLNDLSRKVIGLCIEIHRELGPGLLESVYEECLAYELSRIGLRYERQQPLPVRYKVVDLNCGYRLDFVVDDAVIVELKAVTDLHPIHEAQLLTYLRLARKSLGLLINFNVPVLKQGVKRVVCGDLFRGDFGPPRHQGTERSID